MRKRRKRPLEAPKDIIAVFNKVCNYDCVFCNHGRESQMKQEYWPFKKVVELLDPILEHARTVNIGGCGELSSVPYYVQLLEYLQTKPGQIVFATNGYKIDAPLLRQQNLNHLIFSIHSFQPSAYDQLTRTKGRLPRVIENLKAMLEHPRSWRIVVAMVITKLNWQEPPDFTKFCIRLGVDEVRFLPLADPESVIGRSEYPLDIDPRDIPDYLEPTRIANEMLQKVEAPSIYQPLPVENRREVVRGEMQKCRSPWDQTVIDYDGGVHPCCFLGEDYSMGNIFKGGWEKVWNGSIFNKFRGEVRRGTCQACLDHCRNWG